MPRRKYSVGKQIQENGRRNAATVFDSSIAEHAQRAFGGTYNLFCFTGNAVSCKAKNGRRMSAMTVFQMMTKRKRTGAVHV